MDDLLEVRTQTTAETLHVTLSGELDMDHVDQLKREIQPLWDSALTAVIIDVRALRYVDSLGLKEFVRLNREAQNRSISFSLYIPEDFHTARVVDLTGLAQMTRVVRVPSPTA